jgi:peptide/nickel transport system substrate-binding protein
MGPSAVTDGSNTVNDRLSSWLACTPRSLRTLLAVAAVGLMTACSVERPADEGHGAIQPPNDGVVRIASRRLPPGLANPAAHSGQPSIDIWPAFYDGLTFIDADGQTQPWLATDWALLTPTKWLFTLREDVAFSNGEPFDALAVQAAVDNVLLGYGATDLVRNSLLPTVKSARVVSRHEIEIETHAPDPLLPKRVSQFYPLPPAYFSQVGPREFARRPIGTGPFVVEEWGVGRVTMRANPDSWRPPRVAGLEFIEIPDPTARRQAIESGQVHIAQYLSPEDIHDLTAGGIHMRTSPEPRLRMLVFVDREGSPVKDRRVRLALNHAIDREAIVKHLLSDAMPIATQIGVRASEGFDPAIAPYRHDPALARSLLNEAGYPDGFDLVIDVLAVTNSERTVMEAIAADFGDIGVRARLQTMEFERWRANLLSGNWRNDMFTWAVALDPLYDITRAWQYLSCDSARPPFCQREVSDLIAKRTTEMDPANRKALMQEANRLLHEDPPVVLVHEISQVTGVSGLQDYEVHNLIVRWDRLQISGLGGQVSAEPTKSQH